MAAIPLQHHSCVIRQRASYIVDSLVETTVSRDLLLLTRVDKPATLRQLFRLSCDDRGHVLSSTKTLGQLQGPADRRNREVMSWSRR